jgi:hypothetical protein
MTHSKNILGISLGTRTIGMAMMVNGELVDWYVKAFKGIWSEQKKELILDTIDRMRERYTAGAFAITLKGLAVKIPDAIDRYAAVRDLHTDINLLAQQKGIATETFSIRSLKVFCDVRNKKEIRIKTFELYPELKGEFKKDVQNRNGYYMKLFEAVLAAHVLHMQP